MEIIIPLLVIIVLLHLYRRKLQADIRHLDAEYDAELQRMRKEGEG